MQGRGENCTILIVRSYHFEAAVRRDESAAASRTEASLRGIAGRGFQKGNLLIKFCFCAALSLRVRKK
jgi:hypothetical protein